MKLPLGTDRVSNGRRVSHPLSMTGEIQANRLECVHLRLEVRNESSSDVGAIEHPSLLRTFSEFFRDWANSVCAPHIAEVFGNISVAVIWMLP